LKISSPIGAVIKKVLKKCFYKIASIGVVLQTALLEACVEKVLKGTFYKKPYKGCVQKSSLRNRFVQIVLIRAACRNDP